MDISPLSTVANQAKSTARNLAGGVSAGIRRETSIVGRAGALANTGLQLVQKKMKNAQRPKPPRAGVYIRTEEESRAIDSTGGVLFIAPDGYIRMTPVQAIKLAPGYRAKRVKKAISAILLAAAAVAVVYILVRFNVISF